jgi:hypothetical protein
MARSFFRSVRLGGLIYGAYTGSARILIGSTEKMGAGMNVQRRLRALHHLDAPWRPRDIEQREGRILRQGNLNAEVEIYRYVTEGSFDAYMWQTLETKARFIQQVMSGESAVRSAEDLEGGALTYAEIKAIASGNPAVMEKVGIDTEVRKLDQLRAVHLNQQHKIRWELRHLPGEIAEARQTLEQVRADIATRDTHDGGKFVMSVGARVFSGKGAREEAATALARARLSRRDDYTLRQRAAFKGFDILSRDKAGCAGARAFHQREGNLERAYKCRQSDRHHAEHRAHAARPRPCRRRRTTAAARARKNSHGRSLTPGRAALRARSAAEGIAGAGRPSSTPPSISTKATPKPRSRRANLRLRLRWRRLAARSQLRQQCSSTPCQPRFLITAQTRPDALAGNTGGPRPVAE